MNKQLKAKWIAALRSGDYQQGHHTFKTHEGTYCCLGVLCTVLGRTDLIGSPADNYDGLRDASGLNSSQTNTLADMNDSHSAIGRHTFATIADYIEENIPTVD